MAVGSTFDSAKLKNATISIFVHWHSFTSFNYYLEARVSASEGEVKMDPSAKMEGLVGQLVMGNEQVSITWYGMHRSV